MKKIKFKEELSSSRWIEYNPTIEQLNIINLILNKIDKGSDRKKLYFGITSEVGDGKTYLLNFLVKYHSYEETEYKNIFYKNDCCIIDDIELLDEKTLNKLVDEYKYIIFTYKKHNKRKINIDFDEFEIKHNNKLSYLIIENPIFVNVLKVFEKYSFRCLKIINENLKEKYKKFQNNFIKIQFLFYQKLIEEVIGDSEWNNVKNNIVKNKNCFPKIKNNFSNFEEYLELGIIILDGIDYKWNYDDILILIIFRDWTTNNKNYNDFELPNYSRDYFNKYKSFQYSLIDYLNSKNKLHLINNGDVYLSSILHIKNINDLNCNNIIFDLNSVVDIFNLFKNNFVKSLINPSEIFNKSFQIIFEWFFDEEQLEEIVNNFDDLEKMIVLSFFIINEGWDLRLIKYIDVKKSFLLLKNRINLNELNNYGILFLSYMLRIIESFERDVKKDPFTLQVDNLLSNVIGINKLSKKEIIKVIDKIDESYEVSLIDNLFYYSDKKTELLDGTRHLLNKVIKQKNNYRPLYHPNLCQFNFWIFDIFLNLTKNSIFINWLNDNLELIKIFNDIGFSNEHKKEIDFRPLNYIKVIRDSILYKFTKMQLCYLDRCDGIIGKRIILLDKKIDEWDNIIKNNKNSNFDMSAICIEKLINDLIIFKDEQYFYPYYGHLMYKNLKLQNPRDLIMGDYACYNKIEISYYDVKKYNKMKWDASEHQLETNIRNINNYIILKKLDGENEIDVKLTSTKSKLSKQIWIILSNGDKGQEEIWYLLDYKSNGNKKLGFSINRIK